MSVGAVDPTQPPTFDPNAQDPAKVQAALAAAPPPAAIPDAAPPIAPPAPALGPIDVPQPSAAFTPPDSSAIAKSMTAPAIASALPGAPPSVPGAPSTPAATPDAPTTPSQTDDLKKAQDEEAKAREASDKAQLDLQKSQQPSVEQQNEILKQKVAHYEQERAQQQKEQDQFATAQLAANDQLKQTQDLVKKFKYRDYFSNEDGSTKWGLKIGSALAAGLGAYGAGLTHGPNYALQILNKNMDDWHASQLDHLNQLKDEEVSQRTGIQDAQLARQKAQSDLTLKDAGFDKLIASQLDAAAARQSSASFAPSLTAAAAKLKLDAAEKETAAKKLAVELNLKLGDEERKRRLDEASIKEKEQLANLHGVQAAAGGFAPHHGKGDGAGGGGGVTGDSVSQLKNAIQNGKDGRPLTAGEIQDVANGLHIPAFAKAGHPSVEAITKSVAFVKGQANKEGAQDTKDIDKRFEGIKREAFGPKGPGTQFERLNGMTSVVENAIKNGDKTAATAILEEAGGMLSGGKSTRTTVELLEKLKSTRDEMESKWGHLTGDPGASKAFTGRLNGLLNSVKEEKRKELDAIRQRAVDTEMGEHGLAKEGKAKERALGHLGMFNGITNANGQSRYGAQKPQGDAPGTIRVQNGHKFQLGTDGKWQAL